MLCLACFFFIDAYELMVPSVAATSIPMSGFVMMPLKRAITMRRAASWGAFSGGGRGQSCHVGDYEKPAANKIRMSDGSSISLFRASFTPFISRNRFDGVVIRQQRRSSSTNARPGALGGGGADGQKQRDHHVDGRPKRNRRIISFLTDVEGDRDYLDRYVERSKILAFRPTTARLAQLDSKNNSDGGYDYFPYKHCIDFTCDDGCLVYGGDVWDQGGSDLYVIRQLLDLKRRHPNRVYIVMGNRDMNKMRMRSELGEIGSDAAPPHAGVYWLRGTGRVGDPDLGPLSDDPVERLQWMLGQTMGSPRAFEHRRWELQQERLELDLNDTVLDIDILESYRTSCHPAFGEMGRYLSNSCLALRLGDALFVHGALPLTNTDLLEENSHHPWEDLTFAMPWLEDGMTAKSAGVESIEDWIGALNEFAQTNVDLWKAEQGADDFWCKTGGYDHSQQPHSKLIQYGMGWKAGGQRNPTVVYSSWSDDGMPRNFFPTSMMKNCSGAIDQQQLFSNWTRNFFERTGIRLICSGHQPQGDMPNTIQIDLQGSDNAKAYIICCDTSYSGDTLWYNTTSRGNLGRGESRSGRGMIAVSEVLIKQCTETGKLLDVYSHGRLSDGMAFETRSLEFDFASDSVLRNRASGDAVPLVVGKIAPDISNCITPNVSNASYYRGPWWTRAALRDPEGTFVLAAGEGFNVWNRIIKQ